MKIKLLVTTTSFQDTPGNHLKMLSEQNFKIDFLRGPLTESQLLPVIANYDAILCGDDHLNENVITIGYEGRLRIISKYGVGLDKIDLKTAKNFGIPVTNCPGVNQNSVAEHFFALVLSFYRKLPFLLSETRINKNWTRLTGNELYGKNTLILGLGKVGKEIAKRLAAFQSKVFAYDLDIDVNFCKKYNLKVVDNIHSVLPKIDIVSLNLPLNEETKNIVDREFFSHSKDNLLIVNTARGELVDLDALVHALDSKKIAGYCTDVLDIEPMPKNYKLSDYKNVFISPHIGSRTYESVEKQGLMAVENLIESLKK
jgi:D-3-phosphoglycerate dehydrogenase / 2-oxoglutarate reductase